MKFSLPLLVEGTSKPLQYRVRLLFRPDLLEDSSALLQRSLTRLQERVWKRVEESKREPDLKDFQSLLYCPAFQEKMVDVRLLHKKKTVQCRLLVIILEVFGRRVGYCPQVPGMWFESPPDVGKSLEFHVAEVLRGRLRELEKSGDDLDLDGFGHGMRVWVHPFEFETSAPGTVGPEAPPNLMALLSGRTTRQGSIELQEVGRNLSSSSRDKSELCLGRDTELAQLEQLIGLREDRACVLVVGPRQVGKSSLIRELARRELLRVKSARKSPVNFWLVSPGRLIAGMCYVGQWESRWTAILDHLRKRNHVLVLDDLPGLLQAGVSRDANLNAAQVLKAYLDRKEIRVLAEITAEGYQFLRQHDRALADMFQVVRLEPSADRATLQVALATVRQVDETQAASFSLEATRTVLEISRRYLTDAAFPGKSAALIHQLASRFRRAEVNRDQVLSWFSQRSGLSLDLLDERRILNRANLEQELKRRILGQDEGVAACLEVISIAKAGLRESGRPLASLLFLGPTGVGKTECAKALAEVLFGSADRLLRIDMNEYIGEDSVARLVGSWSGSPGRLTSAIRRQPFSVLLLDEVEKAHPNVLQLLLQLLGDARLTESGGQTADFSQAIVVMTSNLGAREQRQNMGVRSRTDEISLVYRRAAENFFSPELFNRLDRVVPFRPLSRPTVALLAQRQLENVLARDGLSRRQCLLEVSSQALEVVTEAGFHPTLGARALKRTVEEQITAPVSQKLAALSPETPTRVNIFAVEGKLRVAVHKLSFANPEAEAPSQTETDRTLARWLEDWGTQLSLHAPVGSVSDDDLNEERMFYFEIQDGLRQLRGALEAWRARHVEQRRSNRRKHPENLWQFSPEQVARVTASSDLRTELMALRESFPLESQQHYLADTLDLWGRASWLQTRWRTWKPLEGPDMTDLAIRGRQRDKLRKLLADAWKALDLQARSIANGLFLEGPALPLLESGTHLLLLEDGLHCVDVGEPTRVIRIYAPEIGILDLRSGIMSLGPKALPTMLLANLPRPEAKL